MCRSMADLADCVQKMCAQKCVRNYMRQGVERRAAFSKCGDFFVILCRELEIVSGLFENKPI